MNTPAQHKGRAPSPPPVDPADPTRQERDYLFRLAENSVSRILNIETRSVAMRLELEQKRRGFKLMAELTSTLRYDALDGNKLFTAIARRINAALGMHRTVLLVPDKDGLFKVASLQGYPADEAKTIHSRRIPVDASLIASQHPVLVTGEDSPNRLAALREALALPFFISARVTPHNETIALLITGRLREERPFSPRLGNTDAETLQALGSYLATLIVRQRLHEAEYMADHDALTLLPNLRRTRSGLGHILSLAQRERHACAALFVDLDKFKDVNDKYGHAVGDRVLGAVAERLRGSIRESDLVGRVGGDEFVVILANVSHADDAGTVAAKIIETLSAPIAVNELECRIGASIGIAIFPDHATDAASLLKAADAAMYEVKKRGRNNFFFATSANAAEKHLK